MRVTRLRQAVVVDPDRDATLLKWQQEFGLGAAFADPGVGDFGLHNWVVPAGDTFLEVVAPNRDNTTAGRYMERHGGPAGYMVIFQVESIIGARAHLATEQCRTVWNGDFDGISGTHLHPADIGGAIVSVDEPMPPGGWPWGGSKWTENMCTDVVSGLAGVTMASVDPEGLAATWSRLLNLSVDNGSATLPDNSVVSFVSSAEVGGRSGLVGIDLRATDRAAVGRSVVISNTTFRLV